jgi:hypothetical protein
MKKIGILILAVVLALGALGVGYARWSDVVYIDGTVKTGEVCVGIESFFDYDGLASDGTIGILKPISEPTDGTYDHSAAPGTEQHYDKNVAACDVQWVGAATKCESLYEAISITLLNGYPCYYNLVDVHILNAGTIPVKNWKLEISIDGGTTWYPMTLDAWNQFNYDGDADYDFEIRPGNTSLGYQIDPGQSITMFFDIHVMQGATEGATMNFFTRFSFTQWNEYP